MKDLIERLRDEIELYNADMDSDTLEACLFEAADALERMQWNPDMEAGKLEDGTDILVCSVEGVEIAWWSEGNNEWLTREGKYTWADPTKWMHLPPAP